MNPYRCPRLAAVGFGVEFDSAVADPADLIDVEDLLAAFGLELGTAVGRAPVLPDNRPIDRLTGVAVPDECGFTLIGETDGGNPVGRNAGLRHRLFADLQARRPDVLGLVFYPAIGWEMLRELLLPDALNSQRCVKHDRARRCRALIDCQ